MRDVVFFFSLKRTTTAKLGEKKGKLHCDIKETEQHVYSRHSHVSHFVTH